MRIIFIFILFLSISFSQWFSVDHNGVTRTYYMSYPENVAESTPLIINMHGFGGSAEQQQIYSEGISSTNGGYNSWNVFTAWDGNSYDDVEFISMMIDNISENFNIDLNRIYACGMSNGGYMAYRLACDLSDKITAFGSVTGNFMINVGINDCLDQDRKIPIILLHGTADATVNYYPPSFDGALTVQQSIELNTELIESINTNVEIYTYSSEDSSTKFVHYKVYGGGHEWFGSPWATNWGFNASEELINFFLEYELSDFINNYLEGDLNQDSLINVQDIILIINLILSNEYNSFADLNNDGNIDVVDIIQLVNIILE